MRRGSRDWAISSPGAGRVAPSPLAGEVSSPSSTLALPGQMSERTGPHRPRGLVRAATSGDNESDRAPAPCGPARTRGGSPDPPPAPADRSKPTIPARQRPHRHERHPATSRPAHAGRRPVPMDDPPRRCCSRSPRLLAVADGPATSKGTLDFNRDIRPILAEKCLTCHGPDPAQRKAALRLDTARRLDEGCGVGLALAIVPGQAGRGGELVARVDLDRPRRGHAPAEKHKKPLAPGRGRQAQAVGRRGQLQA